MTITTDQMKGLAYAGPEPAVETLKNAYATSLSDLESYFQLCRCSYDDRRNHWSDKSADLRKHGADAFPWEGASDLESHVIGERINHLVGLFMTALERANIRALPTNAKMVPRAKIVGNFLKWMATSDYVPRFVKEAERGANYLLERGILITYVGWNKENRSYLRKLSLEQIARNAPDIAEKIQRGDSDEEVTAMLRSAYEGVTPARAAKALSQLRETGFAELPSYRRQIDEPDVKTLAPDGDWLFPSYVTDPQRAPYGFWRTFLTVQEIEMKVLTDGWDGKFVDHMISKYRGIGIDTVEREQEGRRSSRLRDDTYKADELIEIVYGYQRMMDPIDGSEGIYCTVFHRSFNGDESRGVPDHAKFELLNGYENYPVVVTKLSEDNARLYDTQTFPELLRGLQNQVKVERDARVDSNSMSTLPVLMHPVSHAPSDWGPGRRVPYRRKGEIEYGPTPDYNPGSMEMENTLMTQADRLVGLDEESGISMLFRQFLVNKFLSHQADVLKLIYRCYLRFGPDKVFFQVTGVADPQEFQKADPDENYNVTLKYDVQDTDPENYDRKMERMASLIQLDTNGRLDRDQLLSYMAAGIDPIMADMVLIPAEEAQDKMVKDVTDDLAKIYAGIEVPARPNGAQAAIGIVQQYASQEDVGKRLKEDEAFAERLKKYADQYVFSLQQAQNAEIGRHGTKPAAVGKVDTQHMRGGDGGY